MKAAELAKYLLIFFGGIVTFGLLWVWLFASYYVIKAGKLVFLFLYGVFRIPFAIIQYVFVLFGKNPGIWLTKALHVGASTVFHYKKSSLIIAAFTFWFLSGAFTVEFGTGGLNQISSIVDNTFTIVVWSFTTFLLTALINSVLHLLMPSNLSNIDLIGSTIGGGTSGSSHGGDRHATDIKDLKPDMSSVTSPDLYYKDLQSIVASIKEEPPESVSSSDIFKYWFFGMVVFAILAPIVAIYFLGVVVTGLQTVLGPVMGPLMNFVGLGQAYGDYGFDRFANRYLAGIGQVTAIQEAQMAFSGAAARLRCAAQGPQCLRQWRLNNTQRPGTNNVGETYSVNIEDFRLGSGDTLDVANLEDDYEIPLAFTLSNDMRGRIGIPAYNLEYNVMIIDFDRDTDNPYCATGFKEVDAFDIDGDGEANDLYPGTAAATDFMRIEDFDLEKCELLYPALGEIRTGYLEVKYDYFSQSTLDFEVISLEHMTAEDVEIEAKDSDTADTPVKAALQVNEPALFQQENIQDPDQDDYAGQPIEVRTTLNADSPDIRFRVNDLELEMSQQTCVMNDDRQCMDIDDWTEESELPEEPFSCVYEPSSEEGVLKLDEDASDRLLSGEGDEETLGADWFDTEVPPDIFGCTFGLEEPENISPSGQTLFKDIRANYTVLKEHRLNNFETLNTRCRTVNCPMLDPLDEENFTRNVVRAEDFHVDFGREDDFRRKQRALCDGVDARDGCTPVEDRLEPVQHGVEINQGEVAVNMSKNMIEEFMDDEERVNAFSCEVYEELDSDVDFMHGVLGDEFGELAGVELLNKPAGFDANLLEDVFTRGAAIHYVPDSGSGFMEGWRVVDPNVWLDDQDCWDDMDRLGEEEADE